MRFLYTCLSLIVSVTFALQGADFDIYPSFSSSEESADASPPKLDDGISTSQALTRLGATVGIGGGAYIGFRLAKKVIERIRKSSTTTTASSLIEEVENLRSQKGRDSSFNVTMVEEMKKEQEELWRFIHSLFKNQEEMMAKLEKNSNSGVPESAIKELEESFDLKISEMSKRLDSLEIRLKGIDRDMAKPNQEPSLTEENVQGLIQTEVEEISNSMITLKKEIKNQMLRWLKEHDDAIVEKIRFFGEDIKKLVKHENNDGPQSAKQMKSKPQQNSGKQRGK